MMEYLLEFIRNRKSSSYKNDFGWNVIHTSTLQGQHIALLKYINMHPTLINEGNIYGVTALHLAVRWDQIKCLEILLQQSNINVNIVDEDGWTPLHDAARLNRPKCLQMLLCHPDIAINALDNCELSPIYFSAREGYAECFKLLFEKDRSTADGVNYWSCNLLHTLVRYGRNECLHILLNNNINVSISDTEGSTPLHYAAWFGRHTTLELLITNGYANVNTVNNNGYTALHYAILKRKSECAMKLLDYPNINVNISNKAGYTPLHYAIEWNNCEVIKKLIDQTNAKTDIPDKNGWLCQHKAAADGKIDILQILYDRNLINIYAKTNYGETILEFAFRQKKTLKFLLKMDDKYGTNLIHHAAIQKHDELFQLLIKQPSKYKNIFPPNEFNSRYIIKGRHYELENIHVTLEKHKNVVVYGPGGIGKTALVKFYSYQQNFYSKLIWIDCQSKGSIKKSFDEVAKFLRIPTKKYEFDREPISIVGDIFTKLKMKPSLIVFDNINSIEIIETYIRDYPNIHFIFITREEFYFQNDIVCIELGPVTETAAIAFFDALFHDKILQENDRESIRRLTKTLKYVPIALVAAKFHILREYSSFDLNSYIDKLEEEQMKLPFTNIMQFYTSEIDQIIYSTFIVTLNKVLTYNLLAAAVLLDPIYLDINTLRQLENIIYDKSSGSIFLDYRILLLQENSTKRFGSLLNNLIDESFIDPLCHCEKYIRYSVIEIYNNKIYINSFIRQLIFDHQYYNDNINLCYHIILRLLSSGEYSQHYEHVFRISFSDTNFFSHLFYNFRNLNFWKQLVRYSYTTTLDYFFDNMIVDDIKKCVKKYKLLHEAVKSGDITTVQHVYLYDKNVIGTDEMGHTMIWEAIDKNYSDIISFLIDKGASLNQIDKLNKTPLHRAAFLGKTEIVKFLLEKGVDPNIRNKFQRTPLHYAAMEGYTAVIEELLKHKDTNINARDHYRRSPVFETVRCYKLEALKLFIQKGAKIDTKDNLDLSPVRLAKLQKNKIELLNVFKEYGFYDEPVTNNSCHIFC